MSEQNKTVFTPKDIIEIVIKTAHACKSSGDYGDHDRNIGISALKDSLVWRMICVHQKNSGFKDNEWNKLSYKSFAYCPKCEDSHMNTERMNRFSEKANHFFCHLCGTKYLIDRELEIIYIEKQDGDK